MKQFKTGMNTFWHVLTNTFSSLDYYKKIIKAPFRFSLKYYIAFLFLATLINLIALSATFLYPFSRFIQRLPAHIEKVYPDELVLTIKKGKLSSNVEEPYIIPLSELDPVVDDLNKSVLGITSQDPENFAVIDTKGSVDTFAKYKTLILITRKNVSYEDGNGVMRTSSFNGIDNMKINQSYVHDLLTKYSFYFKNFFPMAIIIFLITALVSISVIKTFYMLFLAGIILILSKIMGYAMSYMKSMQIGLHLDTIAMVLFWLVSETVGAIPIPFLYTLIVSIFAFFVISHLKKAHE